MKYSTFVIAGLFILAALVMPASAFTIKTLDVTIGQNGDATVDAHYDLNFIEQSAVFLKIADPATELQSAFNSGSATPVTVTSATSSSARINVPSFASVTKTEGTSVMTTPSQSFERAEKVLKNYWFAPLISPDLSPTVTTITFPDGYREQYYDQISIPSVSHTITV
jgi:hypothetical protein